MFGKRGIIATMWEGNIIYLRIVVIEGYGVYGSQVAWFPLISPRLPVRHPKPQPQLGGRSNWNYSTKSSFSWKSTWSEEGLGDVEVIPRLGGALSPGLNHRPSFKGHYTIYGIMIIDDYDYRWSLIWYIQIQICPHQLLFILDSDPVSSPTIYHGLLFLLFGALYIR